MKMWTHADLCLSVAKINAYRNKEMWKEAQQWANELSGKLDDLRQYFREQERKGTGTVSRRSRV